MVADCLSRLCVMKDKIKLPKTTVHAVSVELPATEDFLKRIRDQAIKQYWCFREDITIKDGILVKGHQVIAPQDIRKYMLLQVYEGHFGIEKCKVQINSCCYWPRVSKQMVRNCPVCLECSPAKPKIKQKNMLHHKIPETPWCKLTTDIFHFGGANYLVIIDYTSCFPIGKQLRGMDQQSIIKIFESLKWLNA